MVCVKCGKENSSAVCKGCGYNHRSGNIVMLQDVTFERPLPDFQQPNMIFSGTTLVAYNGNETSVCIPDGVTHIANFAFGHNSKLQEITIPGTVKMIMADAFYECRALKIVHLNEGLELIGRQAFASNEKLEEITIPGTVKTIGEEAFTNCHSLQALHLSRGLELIGNRAFSYCQSLVEVTFPETLVSIGEDAFLRSGLVHIVIPGSVRIIEKDSFYECERLQTVYLNTGVRTVEGGAFYGCQCLEHIYVPDTLEGINSYWNFVKHCQIHAFDKSSRNLRNIYASDNWKKEHPELIKEILGQY